MSYQLFIYLHVANGIHWECLVNRLFISLVSWLLIGSALSIVYLSPWCQWYSLGVYCQSSIYLHGVNGTHLECLVNRQFYLNGVNDTHWECLVNRIITSIMSMVLIRSALSIVYLSPCCQWYSLGSSCQSFIYLHGVTANHLECLVNRLITSMVSMVPFGSVLPIVYLSSWCHSYSFGVPCQSYIYLHGVKGTHWDCLVNLLFIFMVSWLLI